MSDIVNFEYRPAIKKIYWMIIILAILALLIIFRVNIVKWTSETYISTTIKFLMVSLVPLSILFRMHFFIRPLIFSKYELADNILKIKFKKKLKIINLDKVQKLSFTLFSPRFFGGCKIKTENGDDVRFLSLLQDNHKVVEYLSVNRKDLKTEAKFVKYINTTKLVHLSWRRILLRLKSWPYLLVKFFALPVGFVFLLNNQMDLGSSMGVSRLERLVLIFVLFIIINFVVAYFYNHFEEMLHNNKVLDKADEEIENWDFNQEKPIYLLTQFVFFLSSTIVLYFMTKILGHLFA